MEQAIGHDHIYKVTPFRVTDIVEQFLPVNLAPTGRSSFFYCRVFVDN